MMCGGVDWRALDRSVPMSMVEGSTRPSHVLVVVVGHVGHVRVGHGSEEEEDAMVVDGVALTS